MKKEKTYEVIADSFYELSQRVSFDKITAKMICEASGVSKATFYRLYQDKYDVMNSFFKIRCNRLLRENPGPERCLEFLRGYASLVMEFRQFFKAAFASTGQNSFWDYLYEVAISYYIGNIRSTSTEPLTEDLRLQVDLFALGTVAITKKWVESTLPMPPDQIARNVFEAMPPAMARYYHL